MFTNKVSSVSVEIEKVENGYVVTWHDDTVNDDIDRYSGQTYPPAKRKPTSGTQVFLKLKDALAFVKERVS